MKTFDECKTFDANGYETSRATKITFDRDTVQIGHTTHRRDELEIDWTKGEIISIHGWTASFAPMMHAKAIAIAWWNSRDLESRNTMLASIGPTASVSDCWEKFGQGSYANGWRPTREQLAAASLITG